MIRSRVFPAVITVPLLLGLSCLIPLDNSEQNKPFRLVRADSDTIAPFGPVRLAFTHPVKNPDSVVFVFSPPYIEFQQFFNGTRDTVSIRCGVPLAGNARYCIRLADPVEASNGALLYPWDDSIVVLTWRLEQEPNDSRPLADSLKGRLFGTIATADDTDWFALPLPAGGSYYLLSKGSSSWFDIRDANGRIAQVADFSPAETLAVPMGFTSPLYLVVYAWNRSNGGYYEVGRVRN